MLRTHVLASLTALFALGGAAQAQILVTTNSNTDTLVAFSPIDGSLIDANYFPVPGTTQVSAIQVNNEIWISEQLADRVVRYDPCGNVLGTMGPTLAGGGLDNIRGMAFINGIVYVTNDGTANGAIGDSLVTFDPAGNYLGTIALTNSPSPFSLMPWQGDILVASSSALDDVHRYTLAGVSVGTFHDTTGLNFAHQLAPASDGNVWCGGFSTNNVVKLDATTGNILTSFAASGARGVYELANGNVMWTNSSGVWIYNGTSSTQVLAGGSYHLNVIQPQQAACHKNYGAGCHDGFLNRSNLFELFPDVATAKATLDGNALQFTLTPNGYVANWLPGVAAALYVTPSGGAAIIADADSTTTAITPSSPIPVPGGLEATWTVSSNGILTAGNPGNQTTSGSPTLSSTATATRLAFYTWCNLNPAEAGSGKIKWEEAAGVLYVTYEGVEFNGGTPTAAPATFQFQVNLSTGDVLLLWTSFSISSSTSDVLVGCTLAGTGQTPASQSLATVSALQLQPDATLVPLTLSAAPAPVINPSTLVTYTATNVPEFVPGSGVYLGTMFLSVNPLVSGFDLTGILTTVPGCNAYIGTLDLDLGAGVNLAPTLSWTFTYDNVFFAPGNVIAAQAVALFDGAFPLLNNESGGFLLSNGVLSTTWPQ
jgi:hypothetical protein